MHVPVWWQGHVEHDEKHIYSTEKGVKKCDTRCHQRVGWPHLNTHSTPLITLKETHVGKLKIALVMLFEVPTHIPPLCPIGNELNRQSNKTKVIMKKTTYTSLIRSGKSNKKHAIFMGHALLGTTEKKVFMACPSAPKIPHPPPHHQWAIAMFWLHFWGAFMVSLCFDTYMLSRTDKKWNRHWQLALRQQNTLWWSVTQTSKR